MPQVSFHRLARKELIEAAAYYEGESEGLGFSFIDAVEHATESIDPASINPVIARTVSSETAKQIRFRTLCRCMHSPCILHPLQSSATGC